jgi:hypothetical protein
LPLQAILHWETYGADGEAGAVAEYDQAMIETGIYRGRQVPGRQGEMEDYGWQEHSARRVAQPVRTGLRQILEAQGWALR